MSVLVFLEHHGDHFEKGSLGVLTKAASLAGGDVAAVVVGGDLTTALATEAGRFGADTVYVADDDRLDPPLPQPRVDVLEAVVAAGEYDTVLFSNSVLAADVAAGLAARLDAGLNWDLVDICWRDGQVNGELMGKRPALQDSVIVDVGWRSQPRLALFRAGSLEAVPAATGIADEAPRIEQVQVEFQPHSCRAAVVDRQRPAEGGPSIEDAEVVVGGGMGLGGPEHFKLAEDLAAALGGVVGSTRAAVYAGWYPYSAQVGQTGKTVSPKLYVALGISGAVQHKVGMQNSKVIVAINTDPAAPIFEFSDLGVVGDVHTIVPEVIELLRQRRSG
jgi:electron transfer flavoprotein alpha subunit